MRLLVRAAAVVAGAALTASGLGPAVAVEPTVPLSQAGPVSAWGYAQAGTEHNVEDVVAIPADLQQRAIRAISVQRHLGVAATTDGRVTAWGDANAVSDGAVPAPAGLSDVVDVRAVSGSNGISAIALSADGRLTAWGAAGGGVTDIPAAVQGHVTAIDTGNDYVMALTDQGTVVQWGNSSQTSSGFIVPADIQGDVAGISVSKDAGDNSGGKVYAPNLALLKDGTVRAWGNPIAGNSAWTVPADIQGDVAKVITGTAPAAILQDGSLRFWGPAAPDVAAPAYVANGLPQGLAGADVADLELANSGTYAMALTTAGDVYLWGGNKTAPTVVDAAVQASWAGPIRAGVSAIATDVSFLVDAVVTTGVAIGSDPSVAGTAQVGQTLTGTAGTFSGAPDSISSQWLADGVAIPGASGSALALTSALAGKRISYQSMAVDGADTVTATSVQTAAVTTPTPDPGSTVPGGNDAQKQQLAKDQAKLKQDQAKLKKAKKAYKKAHGAKKAKLKKKVAKLKKQVKADQRKVKADL